MSKSHKPEMTACVWQVLYETCLDSYITTWHNMFESGKNTCTYPEQTCTSLEHLCLAPTCCLQCLLTLAPTCCLQCSFIASSAHHSTPVICSSSILVVAAKIVVFDSTGTQYSATMPTIQLQHPPLASTISNCLQCPTTPFDSQHFPQAPATQHWHPPLGFNSYHSALIPTTWL